MKVHEIPPGMRTSQGRAIVNLIGCEAGEKVKAFVSVKEFNDTDFIVMATRNGLVKKTVLSAYSKPRKGGIYAIEIRDGDTLIEARITNGEHDILLGTYEGKSIRFSENNIRPSGRKTMGVKGIKLGSKEFLTKLKEAQERIELIKTRMEIVKRYVEIDFLKRQIFTFSLVRTGHESLYYMFCFVLFVFFSSDFVSDKSIFIFCVVYKKEL